MIGCHTLRALAGGASGPDRGRVELVSRDTELELGFALFEQHRYAESLDHFKRAFEKRPYDMGGDEAALMIGKLYLGAPGVPQDLGAAVSWLDKAAGARFNPTVDMPVFDPREPERNTASGEAAMILADLYARGQGSIARDPARSRKYLERAYAVGHIPAAKRLGDLDYEGVYGPRDLKKAFKAYMDAAKFAYVPAMTAVARMYEAGEVDGTPNPGKALAWRNQAARLDDPGGLYALAVAYDHGEGVAADPEMALGFYKVAAMNGEPAAYTALGTYFYKGEQVPQDLEVARGWFQQGAMGADPDGMFDLAVMLAKGEGGEQDRVRAWGWLKIAQTLGHPDALAAARALEAQLTSEERAGVAELARAADRSADGAPGPDPDRVPDPTFVGLAPGGPPWWKVTNKVGATIWVLGLPTGRSQISPRWNTAPLRQTLQGARLVIAPYAPQGLVLTAKGAFPALPKPLADTVAAAAVRLKKPLRNRVPTLTDALNTYNGFFYRGGYASPLPLEVVEQARRQKIGVINPARRPGPNLASVYTGGKDVAACVEAMVKDMETPAEASKAAGAAWGAGDVAGALAAPPGVLWACDVLWPGYRERSVGFTTEAIALALDMPGKVVATVDIGQLTARDGILARLRARGLEVSGPMQPPAP